MSELRPPPACPSPLVPRTPLKDFTDLITEGEDMKNAKAEARYRAVVEGLLGD